MRPKTFTSIVAFFVIFILASKVSHAQTCCSTPDSLTVTSVTDSSFCVRWKIKTDSIHCDSVPHYGQLQYRPVGATNWTTVTMAYSYPFIIATKCDTASPCTKYQWRVRNICLIAGDTIFTSYVSGPRFTTACDSFAARKINATALRIYPNPAKTSIMLEGKFASMSKVTVIVSDMQGNTKVQREVSLINGTLRLPVDISSFDKGIYFVTIRDGKNNSKYSFIKN